MSRHSIARSSVTWTLGLATALALVVATGCSVRDDSHFNRFNATDNAPSVLRAVDQVLDIPADALDNLDQRVENLVY
jgi:hypothetical protein